MKLAHIINAVWFQCWNITREGHQAVAAIVRPHIAAAAVDFKFPESASEDTDFFGNPLPKMERLQNGVAVVPIQGTLIHHASMMDKQCGACSYQDIKANVTEALDEGFRKIVLNVDSPGGMSQGASETGRFIARAAEFARIEAVTDGLMCSAAYEVCAAAHSIKSTRTGQVGSIGTFLAWLDESERYKMEGLSMDVISSGPLKGAGVSGTTLTHDQRANFQAQVNKFASMFKEHVLNFRGVDDSSMQGQSFIGDEAADAGLVDEIIEDVEECFGL
jgi:ClpP class serine protease